VGHDSDAPHMHRLAGIPVEPVFITGPHRSGTTLLYSLLQATQRFNGVTAYHVLRYRQILARHLAGETEQAKTELAEQFRAAGVLDRVIDGMRVTPDMPEEYGFVIADPGPPRLRPANLKRFAYLCRKVQFTGEPGRPLLLKNPWDFGRSRFAKQHFTRSKFLFLHRDPARTLNSQLNAARSMLAARNAYLAMLAPRYGLLFRRPLTLYPTRWLFAPGHGLGARLLARGATAGIESAARDRAELPSADCFDVRYEDLCARPNETMAGILGWLGLNNSGVPDVSTMIAPRGGKLLPEVERLRPTLAARLSDHYREFGYAARS
jgi:Sulfotransferase family